jgi:hypothetical protein
MMGRPNVSRPICLGRQCSLFRLVEAALRKRTDARDENYPWSRAEKPREIVCRFILTADNQQKVLNEGDCPNHRFERIYLDTTWGLQA